MGRFLKIAVYIAVLFLGYLWVATVAKSCNKTSTADADTTEVVEDIASGDEFEDDFFEDEDDSEYNELDEMGGGTEVDSDTDSFEEIDSNPVDYTEVDEIIEDSTPASGTTVTTRSSSNLASSSGRYLLLAGSYLIEDNAQQMVRKLNKIGYANAEVVVFDMSQYHSVCAGRYTSLSSAKQESSALKRKGVDNYVHTKQ